MATYVRKPLPIDQKKSRLWALASLGSAGIGVAGVQLFDLVNRETHRAHRLELKTLGIGVAPKFTGSYGASDYENFRTPRDVSFFDFNGTSMTVRETNAILYSWTTVSFWGQSVRISGGGLNLPGLAVSNGTAKILFSDGNPVGTPDFILDLKIPAKESPTGPQREFAKESDPGIRIPGDVLFDFDKYLLKPGRQTEDALSRLLHQMSWSPDRGFLIEGHTDSIGGEQYNKALGKRRAETVAAWIKVRYPAWGKWIKTEGVGKERPVSPNNTEAGRAKNRRIEVWTLPLKLWNDY